LAVGGLCHAQARPGKGGAGQLPDGVVILHYGVSSGAAGTAPALEKLTRSQNRDPAPGVLAA
jgi:hypothetical protein